MGLCNNETLTVTVNLRCILKRYILSFILLLDASKTKIYVILVYFFFFFEPEVRALLKFRH